jgi:mannosyltransferase OCH1-like enzyme
VKILNEFAQMNFDEIVMDDRLRSSLVKAVISESQEANHNIKIPRTLVQFWDSQDIPNDVRQCLDSWRALDSLGFTRCLFDESSALNFIAKYFDDKHTRAFKQCSHPAMQSDYFRLCFIYQNGGIYIDADDEYTGNSIEATLSRGHLKLNPLCYRISTNTMENPFKEMNSDNDLIFYVNNNPLAASAAHPLIKLALDQAANRLLAIGQSRDIQRLTGPGNLTEALVRHTLELTAARKPLDFEILSDWGSLAVSKWPLDYRQSDRNWRRWSLGRDSA